MTTFDIQQLQTELAHKNPRTILKKALELFDNIAISFSGAEDVVLIDMAVNYQKRHSGFLSGYRPPASRNLPLYRKSQETLPD